MRHRLAGPPGKLSPGRVVDKIAAQNGISIPPLSAGLEARGLAVDARRVER